MPHQAKDVFLAALEKDNAADRAAYLDEACGGDAELRRRVEALLAAHEASGSLLDEPARLTAQPPPGPTGEYLPRDVQPGLVIAGRYTLEQKLGEGGMGEVWVAKQSEPVKRRVALKLIKPGMDSRSVLQRFEQERQALALMDHPNIAKVLDAGTTADRRPHAPREELPHAEREVYDGRPFFVMELVNGLPLTRFCDEAKLGIRERLELFVPICQAVQHAHQKGIVHRDLKPSNILVTLYDGKPVPKVIDFGVAKATGGKLTDESLSTQFGAVVGTIEYMSPEQAGFSALDVDTRADIYSLGVILYELLTGLRPFDSQRLKKAALDEMIRIIREEEPPRPSTRLSSDASAPSLAAVRQTEPKRLATLMRGELDWVVMKCLEKQRERRYETANALSRDVQRYLADEPVEAHPPSAAYRLRKFLRKNRGPVIAASVLVVMGVLGIGVVLGIVGTTWGLVESRRQLNRAEAATLEAQAANALTAERLKQIETINNTVFDIFTGFDIRKVKEGPDPFEYVLAQKLVEAGQKLDAKAIHDPLVLANLQDRLGQTLVSLGRPQDATGLFSSAREIRTAKLGPEHPDTLGSMGNLAAAYQDAGKLDLALLLAAETFKLRKAKLGPEHPSTLTSMNNLAAAYQAADQLDNALPLYEEVLKLRKAKLGHEHPYTLASMNNLATIYRRVGQIDLALPLLEETLKRMKAQLGPEHPNTLVSMVNLAGAYQQAGKLDLALPLYEETLKLQKAQLGPEHPDTLMSMNNLAAAYWRTMQLQKSIPLFEETLKRREARLGRNHPETLRTVANLGVNYKGAGRFKEAIPLLEEAWQASKKYPELRWVGQSLLDAYAKAGEHVKLSKLLQEQLAEARKALPMDSSQLAGLLAQIGSALLEQKKWANAEPLLRECLAIREKQEPDAWTTFNTKSLLGGALLGQKKYADAEPLLLAGYEGLKQREKTIPPQGKIRIPEAIERLVKLYEALDKPEEAAKWRKELEAAKAGDRKP